MNAKELYDVYQEKIEKIWEVDKAEEIARKAYDEVCAYNRELADKVDMAMGILARAYEAQGFNGGLAVAKDML